VGRTGNAATTAPHVHFEVRPNSGPPVNPFPLLAELEPARTVKLPPQPPRLAGLLLIILIAVALSKGKR
jgi:hypothetical protein